MAMATFSGALPLPHPPHFISSNVHFTPVTFPPASVVTINPLK